MTTFKRLLVLGALLTAALGAGGARADSLCARAGFHRPPVSVTSDTVCVPMP